MKVSAIPGRRWARASCLTENSAQFQAAGRGWNVWRRSPAVRRKTRRRSADVSRHPQSRLRLEFDNGHCKYG